MAWFMRLKSRMLTLNAFDHDPISILICNTSKARPLYTAFLLTSLYLGDAAARYCSVNYASLLIT